MFKNKKNIVGIIIIIVLMSVTITGCGNQDNTPEPSVTEQQNPAPTETVSPSPTPSTENQSVVTEIDTANWVPAGNTGLTIPSGDGWRYEIFEPTGEYLIRNDQIGISIFFGQIDAAHASTIWGAEPFTFNDEHTGYLLADADGMLWFRMDGTTVEMSTSFDSLGHLTDYDRDVLTAIAMQFGASGSGNIVVRPTFRRSDYQFIQSTTDLIRFPDNHLSSRFFLEQLVITQMFEPRVYLVRTDGIFAGNEHIIIDNRLTSGANGMVGDRVSVYGIFSGNETLTSEDGRREQMPIIIADRLIFNNLLPTPEDMAEALVHGFYLHDHSYGNSSQYLGGSRVRLHMGVSTLGNNHLRVLQGGVLNIPANTGPRSDGFGTWFEWVGLSDMNIDFVFDFERGPDIPVLVTGSIASMRQSMGDPSILTIVFHLEDIELHPSVQSTPSTTNQSGSEFDIVGTWVDADRNEMTLNADGTGEFDWFTYVEVPFTWQTENNRITVDGIDADHMNVSPSSGTIDVIWNWGDISTFNRQ